MITRTPLRADVHRELLGLILKGALAPGDRLRDTALAEQLGVSRTPVREALLRLEREGFIDSRMGRGFSVLPLAEQEVREVYPLVALLEGRALRSAGPLTPAQAARLEALGLEQVEADPIERIDLDTQWHRTLLEGCGNQHLLRILGDLKRIIFRYECTFMQVSAWVAESNREHHAVQAAYAAGDLDLAERLLETHWEKSLLALLSRLHLDV
jgi:DNA-binding GntR family transcriptional regulator